MIRILAEKADVLILLGFWKSNKSCRDYINTKLVNIAKTLNMTTEHETSLGVLSFREIIEFMDKKELGGMDIMEGLNYSKIIRSKKGIRMMVKRAENNLTADWNNTVHFDGNTYTFSSWQATNPITKFLIDVINERDYGCFGWLSCILESEKNNPLIRATERPDNLNKWLIKAIILTDDEIFIEKLNKKWGLANGKSLSYSILLSLEYNLKHFDIFLKKRKDLGLISTKSNHDAAIMTTWREKKQGDFDVELLGFVVNQYPWFTKDIMEFIWCDFDNFYDILCLIRGNSNQYVEKAVMSGCIKQIKERHSVEAENIRFIIEKKDVHSSAHRNIEFIMKYVDRFIKNQNEKLPWDE